MGRRVITQKDIQDLKTKPRLLAEEAQKPTKEDDYPTQLLKYIPAEIVAAFVAINGALKSAASVPMPVGWIVFIVLTVITPLYIWRVTKKEDMKNAKAQIAVSTFAFVFWVFAIGGPFTNLSWYLPIYGTIILPLYTLLIPLFVGRAKTEQTQ
jgi:hypothetical protein